MTTVLIVLAASGWGTVLLLLRSRRATRRPEVLAPAPRPDFSLFADEAQRFDMPASAALYRDMNAAWPEPEVPELVRADPGENHLPVSQIDREDVTLLHGVHCYRGKERSRYDRDLHDRDPWSGKCICHHAVWHSCPDPKVGRRIFASLPSRGVRTTA